MSQPDMYEDLRAHKVAARWPTRYRKHNESVFSVIGGRIVATVGCKRDGFENVRHG